MNYSTIILAGGKSSRMGSDKGLLQLGELTFVEYVIRAVEEITEEIIIVTKNNTYRQFGHVVVQDIIPDKGPLGGIHTGLKLSSSEQNIVLSCDIPFIDHNVIEHLMASHTTGTAIASYKDQIHPLIGVYGKPLIKPIEKHLRKDKLKIRSFLTSVPHEVIDFPEEKFHGSSFYNINTTKEFNTLCHGY
jgi:molybdopterin-guanine dinucleotide biosynthesis protein A